MWWGRRDALCRISAAALWPGGDAVGGAKELAVSGGPKNGERESAASASEVGYGKQKEPTFGRNFCMVNGRIYIYIYR